MTPYQATEKIFATQYNNEQNATATWIIKSLSIGLSAIMG